MKKILALLLILTCLFSVVACNNDTPDNGDQNTPDNGNTGNNDVTIDPETDPLGYFSALLKTSVPTLSEVVATQKFGKNVLTDTVTIATGTVDGLKASKLVRVEQKLNDVENQELNYITSSTSETWYLEGKGTSTNKGRRWNADGKDFAPSENSIRLFLKEEYFTEYNYDAETGTLVLEASWEYASQVLAYILPSADYVHEYDTTITMVAAGGRITSITIEYEVEEEDLGDINVSVTAPDTTVVIAANYYYDLQDITFN
jgi:hypothetical protein